MRIAIYTSLAVNYLAKARVLAQSAKAVNPAIDVVAVVCDRFPDTIDPAQEPFDQIWMVEEYPAKLIKSWIFKHDIMELSTAVKGWALQRLLDAGYDYVLYLDPDCWVLEDPAVIIEQLPPACSVGVVPHTTREATSDEEIRLVETSSLRHGIYNLGFLIVRNDANGRRLAKWWADRLAEYCYDDFRSGLFTDQRWFDLAVGYFEFIKVIRHSGVDVASWNVGQRTLSRAGDGYNIDGDPLIFYHFSGVGPTGVHRWVRDKFAPSDPLAAEIEFRYERLIDDQGQQHLQRVAPYFDLYSDGGRVERAHRRFYRERADIAGQFADPYDVTACPNLRDTAVKSNPQQTSNALTTIEDPAQAAPISSSPTPQPGHVDAMARRLFHAEYFRSIIDAAQTDVDKLWAIYVSRGWGSSLSGNRFFDVGYYRLMSGDLDPAHSPSPLHHYVSVGLPGKISPSWIFDEAYYLQRYGDVADAVRRGDLSCAFEHFSLYGASEGRSGCGFFNERRYLELNQDVAGAVASHAVRSGEHHYVKHGRSEGRPFR